MPTLQHAIVIHSPHSGRSAQLTEALTYARQNGITVVDLLSIADLDGLPAQGAEWEKRNIGLVIAAGGDGLVGGVITHIVECGLPLGILPLGTSNDIARSLSIPQNLAAAAAVLAHGQQIAVDIGVAQPAEQAPHTSQKQTERPQLQQVSPGKQSFFAHVLTAGINVEFARLATDATLRQRYGSLTYPYAALEVMRKHTAVDMELCFEGLRLQTGTVLSEQREPAQSQQSATLRCRTLLVAVINAPIFGGAFQLAVPNANMDDRLLDIVVVEETNIDVLATRLTSFFHHPEQRLPASSDWHMQNPPLRQAEQTSIPGLHHVQAKSVQISTGIDPQDLTLDGEIRGQTPALIRVAEQRLHVLVP